MIFIEPIGGLCNRMRAINSAYHLALDLEQELTVIWTAKAELNCPYEKLFLNQSSVEVIENREKTARRYKLRRYFSDLYLNEEAVGHLKGNDHRIPLSFFRDKKRIYIHTGLQFYRTENYPKLFVPTEAIRNLVEEQKRHWQGRMVGIHIRRTDNMTAIQGSSTDGFIVQMEKELLLEPQTHFFLATDSNGEAETLRNKFGSRIYMQEDKKLERDSEEGMKAAFVDLLCLAGTEKLIGSYWSSFSDLSSEYYGIEKVIVFDEKRRKNL